MNSALASIDTQGHEGSAQWGSPIKVTKNIKDLADIAKADLELVVWRRTLSSPLGSWIEHLDPEVLPELRVLIEPNQSHQSLGPLLDASGLPAGDMRDLLLEDIDHLVTAFAVITDTDLVDVRLERVRHDACWRFHRDCVEARLLTTYRGPATEWVQPSYADQALRDQKEFDGPLERLGLHDVALFKGSCAEDGSGIVHRSPPILGTGQNRLFLCLNKPSLSSPEPWKPAP